MSVCNCSVTVGHAADCPCYTVGSIVFTPSARPTTEHKASYQIKYLQRALEDKRGECTRLIQDNQRLLCAIKGWKAEEALWKEREMEQLAYLENQGKQLHEERLENARLTARLAEAEAFLALSRIGQRLARSQETNGDQEGGP